MTIKSIMVAVFSLKEFEQSMVNSCLIQTYGDYIKELFKEELYVKLENEDVIYHKSQMGELIEHVKELTQEK